jgi:serine/threonine protein kinase
MPLVPGSRLGPYEIRGTLGAGGMGTVYRAHDPRLARDIALKILPENVARDAESLARFTREARAVAALNHPHIVTIHSTEDVDGLQFITMELIEGRTLDQLMPQRASRWRSSST